MKNKALRGNNNILTTADLQPRHGVFPSILKKFDQSNQSQLLSNQVLNGAKSGFNELSKSRESTENTLSDLISELNQTKIFSAHSFGNYHHNLCNFKKQVHEREKITQSLTTLANTLKLMERRTGKKFSIDENIRNHLQEELNFKKNVVDFYFQIAKKLINTARGDLGKIMAIFYDINLITNVQLEKYPQPKTDSDFEALYSELMRESPNQIASEKISQNKSLEHRLARFLEDISH